MVAKHVYMHVCVCLGASSHGLACLARCEATQSLHVCEPALHCTGAVGVCGMLQGTGLLLGLLLLLVRIMVTQTVLCVLPGSVSPAIDVTSECVAKFVIRCSSARATYDAVIKGF
jgi:hypothetical protein